MSEFLAGVSKAKTVMDVIEFCEMAIPRINNLIKDHKHTKEFFEALEKQNPAATSVNSQNTAFYETTGLGSKEIQNRLHAHNIPNVAVEMTADGRTVIAVPKQFAAQANLILGQTAIINDSQQRQVGQQLPREQQQFLKKISENKLGEPSPMATRGLTSGQVEAMEMSPGAAVGLGARLQRDGIPYTSFVNTQTGKTTVCFDKVYAAQAQYECRELERTPTELGRNEFMARNMGQPIVEKAGITEGQMRLIRNDLMGSGLQYNAERQADGTFTLRYPQKEMPTITPAVVNAIVVTNGRNGKAFEEHAAHITEVSRQAADKARDGTPCYIVDANDPANHFTIDKTGLRDASNKLIVGRQDEKFEAHVYAATSQMKAPIAKSVDKITGQPVEDVFTREEIIAAKEGAALANPDQASLLAGQVVCLSIQPNLAQPNASISNVVNQAAMSVQTIASGIEEDGYRLSPEELQKLTHIPGDAMPDEVVEFIHSVHGLTPEELTNLSDSFRQTAAALSDGFSSKQVGVQDKSLKDIQRELSPEIPDAPEREEISMEDL